MIINTHKCAQQVEFSSMLPFFNLDLGILKYNEIWKYGMDSFIHCYKTLLFSCLHTICFHIWLGVMQCRLKFTLSVPLFIFLSLKCCHTNEKSYAYSKYHENHCHVECCPIICFLCVRYTEPWRFWKYSILLASNSYFSNQGTGNLACCKGHECR